MFPEKNFLEDEKFHTNRIEKLKNTLASNSSRFLQGNNHIDELEDKYKEAQTKKQKIKREKEAKRKFKLLNGQRQKELSPN